MVVLSLYHGDCLEIMKQIEDNSVDLIICDLPYGCLATGGGKQDPNVKPSEGRKIVSLPCAWDIKINLEAFWKEVKRIRKSDHSPTIHFCTTKFGYELIESNRDEFRYDLVWDKGRGVSFLSANKMPMRSHEMIYIFSKAGAYYNRVDIVGDFKAWDVKRSHTPSLASTQYGGAKRNDAKGGDGKRCVLSVIHNSISFTRSGHPTEKPKELYKFLIERYCPENGTVLDPTFGSGNSVFTAFELNRNAIGIEKDDKFYKKASDRADTL
jgi:site-specific DNA-methyltransferase (adenine-specific)